MNKCIIQISIYLGGGSSLDTSQEVERWVEEGRWGEEAEWTRPSSINNMPAAGCISDDMLAIR